MPITRTLPFLPAVFQTPANQKFLNATLDQLVTEPNLVPINGYVGRKFAPGVKSINDYVREPSVTRADYQLEPSVIVKDQLTGEVDFHISYPEVLQKIGFYGGKTANQNNLWSSEYYNYDPKINLDAFINFGQYYWLPNGPDAVDVYAGVADLERTFFVYPNNGAAVYNFSGYGTTSNPDIVLARGGNYRFEVNQPGKSFWIQTDPGVAGKQINNPNLSSREVFGVTNNGTDLGAITFNVPTAIAQDFFIDMPVVQNIDLVTTLNYSQLQGQLVSFVNETYGGIDGQRANLNNKYLIFATQTTADPDWTYNSSTVPTSQRYGIWQIQLTAVGSDYLIDLVWYANIPVNYKVIVQSGVTYGNTEWYKNASGNLAQTPIITAPLNTLYYQDSSLPGQIGIIRLVDPNNNVIDIDTEVLGKLNYVSPNGVNFTNGLKVRFDESVLPAQYQNNEYYVDGVGTGITLTLVSDLIVNYVSPGVNYNPVTAYQGGTATATINASSDQLTISTNSVPENANVSYGTFPNATTSKAIIDKEIDMSIPYRAGLNAQGEHISNVLRNDIIGVSLPGILLSGPYNGWYIPNTNSTKWHYNSSFAKVNGQDVYNGYPGDLGNYIYTDSTFITANAWGNTSGFNSNVGGYTSDDGHSKLIGFAIDGYPIYGPFGYSNPISSESSVVRMRSSYVLNGGLSDRPGPQSITVTANSIVSANLTVSTTFGLNPGMRLTTNDAGITSGSVWIVKNGLQTVEGAPEYTGASNQIQLSSNVTIYANSTVTFEFLPGTFIEDYTYQEGYGTLDQYNGRYCITPEFPNGTYAYFATQDTTNTPAYPYFVGSAFYGSLEVDTNTSLSEPDYLIINRSSRDLNPWTRRNRWFHEDVISATSSYNRTVPILNQDQRAKRPIIEFIPNLQLYDFGKIGLQPVDLFDTTTTQPFLTIEGQPYVYIDGINVTDGMRIIFSADQDPTTRNKIWVVNFVDQVGTSPSDPKVIHLTLAQDGDVVENETVSVKNGFANVGKSFYYTGTAWDQGQQKLGVNQAPLFDVFDQEGISLGDRTKYPPSTTGQTFNGTKIYSYKEGTGVADPVLGFPLSYKNLNNIGDIEFQNNFDSDVFRYVVDEVDYLEKINTGYLYQNNEDGSVTYLNAWTTNVEPGRQYQIIPYVYDGISNYFVIDVVPEVNVTIPNLMVFVNFKLLSPANYQVFVIPNNKRAITINPTLIKDGDQINILAYSEQQSSLGYYEVPPNLNYNAQNISADSVTLGEMRNHIGQLTENATFFQGAYPGKSNLRDIYVNAQGGTILQQGAPTTFASMFLGSESMNFVNALLNAQQEYSKFKNKFITIASLNTQINYSDPVSAVDIVLQQINLVKTKTFPWFYSDMVPYGDNKNVITYTVFDPAQRSYEITNMFTLTALSNQSVLVYLNGVQLVYGRDYTFSETGAALVFTATLTLAVDDTITIVEYYDTDGNWIPETPTKLGMYPKFTPEIYTDTTYVTPRQMLRGHDGSLTPTFGDYRDQMLLELEKRIFNNVKVEYDERLYSVYNSIPGKFRDIGYDLTTYNAMLAKVYLPWTGFNKLDYVTNTTFEEDNAFTFNYGQALDVIDGQQLPGSWRACYEYFYDTQAPHLRPWEMLGFSIEPDWWQDNYGPAPYTAGNGILWAHLEQGYIADGTRQGIDPNFARPGLLGIVPVNENGQLLPPIGLLTNKYYPQDFSLNWKIGQWSPVETAWRNSSDYPFALQYIAAITQPAKYFAMNAAFNKYKYNQRVDQYLVESTNARLTQADVDVNGYVSANGTISRAASYINWIGDYLVTLGLNSRQPLLDFIRNYNVQLTYRMAGFSGKNYLKVLAEQNSPNSINQSVMVPDNDFDIVVNKSTPIINPRYSALIVQKTSTGFKISGYDQNNPFFSIVAPATSGKYDTITVLDQSVQWYTEFTNQKFNIPYETEFTTYQQMATFMSGYQRYLNILGFRFDYYDSDLGEIRNFQLSIKEFLFWAQQQWPTNSVIVISPVADRIKFQTVDSSVDAISNSFYGSKVMTQNFQTLDYDAYTVNRDQNLFRLTLDNSNNLIGFIGFDLVQFEHLLIFNNKTQFNDIIYDPATGQRQYRLKLVGSKTGGWNGSMSAQGFMYNAPNVPEWRADTDYLKGDLIDYKNFYYSASKDLPGSSTFNFADWLPVNKDKIKTGLLPNFATNAVMLEDFYDTDSVNLESKFDLYSLGLIGYRNRSYLNDLGVDDTTQVKFYQGFIKQKGTRNAIKALANVTFNTETTSLAMNEEWAFRVGAYGSLSTNQFVELVLDENVTLNNPTSLQVNANNSVTYSSVYTSIDGMYKSSTMPFVSPFLLNRTNNSVYTDDIQTAGYVNIEDADLTLFDIKDISTFSGDLSNIGVGTTIWCAKNYQSTWDVYRVSETNAFITRIENALNGKVQINTDEYHGLAVGDVIALKNTDKFTGFYNVIQVTSRQSFVVEYTKNLSGFNYLTTFNSPLYKLVSLRHTYASQIKDSTPLDGWKVNSNVWVDTNSSTGWAVYNLSAPWSPARTLTTGNVVANGELGATVKISSDNNFAVIGSPGYASGEGAIINYILTQSGDLQEDITIQPQANATISYGSSLDSGDLNFVTGASPSADDKGYVFCYSKNFLGQIQTGQVLSAIEVDWTQLAAAATRAAANNINDAVVELLISTDSAGRKLGDLNDSGTISAADATLFTQIGSNSITPTALQIQRGFIVRDTILSDPTAYPQEYFTYLSARNNTACFGKSVALSHDDQWLYVGAPDLDAVYVFGYQSGVANANVTLTGDGINTVYPYTFDNPLVTTPEAVELLLVTEGVNQFVPYVDFVANSTAITFATPPTGTIEVRQRDGYRWISTVFGNANSNFGNAVATAAGGTQFVVGAPNDDVSGQTNAGSASVYDRTVEKFIAIDGQTLFGGYRTPKPVSKVYVDNTLLTNGVDYTIISTNWIQINPAPGAGSVITIETDSFNLIENISAVTPLQDVNFGHSVDLCNNNCSIYVGAPYQDYAEARYSGAVYRFLNQGRVYGTIEGTVENPTVNIGDSVRINDMEVVFQNVTLQSVVDQISPPDPGNPGQTLYTIPGVTAYNSNNKLKLVCDSVITANKLRILPGFGTGVSDLGLDVFVPAEFIPNPTLGPYDKFGLKVRINDNSDALLVASEEATTNEECIFDDATTTFDADSILFIDPVESGAVWVLSYMPDARNTIDYPGNFLFVEQITPGSLGSLNNYVKFGSDVDVSNYEMLIGSRGYSVISENAGITYKFNNPQQLKGWDVIRQQAPKVDIQCLIKNYIYSASDQTIIYNLDYIDPAKGKILGRAEQDITYKTDYDPAIYNNAGNVTVSTSSTFHWNSSQVGQVWWDLDSVRYLDYEQGSIKYRTANWGRVFPGSRIEVYEWVESIYPPSQYVANGGDGEPKYSGSQAAYVTQSYVDPITNIATVKYFFWVKNKTTLTANQFGREIPTTVIADLIRNPKNSGIKYMAALQDDTVAVYNIIGEPVGRDTILHVDYATYLNSNIIHSEYALLSEQNSRADLIPQNIFNKLVDSVSGIDKFGNPVPDPTLPAQIRYGIDIRPRQSMFIDRATAVKEMVEYCNAIFKQNIISQGYDLSTLNSQESVPPADSGFYDITVPDYETLGYVDVIAAPNDFKVLVQSDSTVSGLWTIYTKQTNNTWLLTKVQSYRTSDYWEYVDWYAEGFGSTIRPRYTVNTIADLTTLSVKPLDIVKVLNNGQGQWVLLQVFANIVKTVGIQNGTIQFKDSLYDLAAYGMAFDNGNFDVQRFDQDPSLELRKILAALQNNLFINQLSQDFIDLFFVFIYYVLNEQKYIDWAFKTSFINVLHKLRGLTQPPIYNQDSQSYYQQYIEEVKPYHTTIREYVIDYQGSDNVLGYVTDFDVPAYYDPTLQLYRSPSGEFIQDATTLTTAPYQDWLAAYPYYVASIQIIDGGTGYTLPPNVTVTGSTLSNDAVAKAFVTNGVVTRIEVLYPGTNYITQPTVTITGGNGTGARAYAQLRNDLTRKVMTTLVYDRVTYDSTVQVWTPNTSYTRGAIIAHAGVAYTVTANFTSTGTFVGNDLSVYPQSGFEIANDRIQAYYQPGVGLPGKDFALLQTGIDYPGVVVDGPGYADAGGFDIGGFDSIPFDSLAFNEDGTAVISEAILDTVISSSYLDTSLGTKPEDITVDGGGYVDTYSSHAPEELVPGRVYDTLDMTVRTLSVEGSSGTYNYWLTYDGYHIGEINVIDGGLGYSANVVITVEGSTGYGVAAIATLDANGSITAIQVISQGLNFTTVPNVVITGGNTSPARAAAVLTQDNFATFDYRIFKDMNDNYQYLAMRPSQTTTLSANLTLTANTIQVADSSLLFSPSPLVPTPGVIYIDGERITYWVNETATNTLRDIRRGTAGTGASTHLAGASVIDGSVAAKVPQSDNYSWTPNANVTVETTSTAGYTFVSNVTYIRSNLWYNLGTGVTTNDISIEFQGNLLANTITTETDLVITTDQTVASPTDGQGLYASTKTQAIFIKQT